MALDEITEFEFLDPERVDAVKGPANGTPFLMLKSVDENPLLDTDDVTKSCGDDECDVCKAKLKAKQRNALSDKDFAIPETRSYPIHDESHARNALSRVSQHGTPDEKKRVRAAVHRRYPDIGESDAEKAMSEDETNAEKATQESVQAQQARGASPSGSEGQTRENLAREHGGGGEYTPNIPHRTSGGNVDVHARHGDTAPDKTDRRGESLSQTRQVQPDDAAKAEGDEDEASKAKAKPIEVDNPDNDKDDDWDDDAKKALGDLNAALEAIRSLRNPEAINRAATLTSGLVDGNTQTATKEVDMTPAEVAAAIKAAFDERDEAKRLKKQRKAEEAAKAEAVKSTEDVEKGAQTPESTTGTENAADVIKGLQERIAALEGQPAAARPFVNASGLQAGAIAPVQRSQAVEGNAFKSLDDRVEKARESGNGTVLREALRERAMAKLAANNRASVPNEDAFLAAHAPVPLLGSNPDARGNALAAAMGARPGNGGGTIHRV